MAYTFTRTGAQIEEIHNTVEDPKSNAQFSDDIRAIAGEYRGLWPDTGGSANKGDTYQTQASGTGTGQYFTALQNTTADPVDDDINWIAIAGNSGPSEIYSYQSPSKGDMALGVTNGGEIVPHAIGQVWSVGASTSYLIESSVGLDGISVTGDLYANPKLSVDGFSLSELSEKSLPVGVVTPPAEFNDQMNLVRFCDGRNIILQSDPYDLMDFTKGDGVTDYYVNYVTGDNANDGLTSGTAFKTLSYALTNFVSPAQINVEDKWVGYQSLVGSQQTVSGKVKIKSSHESGVTNFVGMRESYDQATFNFNDEGNGVWSTSEATTTSAIFASLGFAMFDDKYQDYDGVATPIPDVGSLAACVATAGSQYHDESAKKRWIHLNDGRKPDPYDGWIYAQLGSRLQLTQTLDDGVALIENVSAYYNVGVAGVASIRYRHTTTSENNSMFGIKNFKVSGGCGNGLEVYDAKITAASNGVATNNRRDGFNYHSFVTTGTKGEYMTVYEYNCSARDSGYDGFINQPTQGQSENATTCHDSIHIERFNGIYGGGKGSTVADVNGCVSVNWCCNAGNPNQPTAYPYIFWHDNYLAVGSNNGMWLWGCLANDDGDLSVKVISTTPQSGSVSGVVHVKNWLGKENVRTDPIVPF